MYTSTKRNLIALVINAISFAMSATILDLVSNAHLVAPSVFAGYAYAVTLYVLMLGLPQLSIFGTLVMYSKDKGEFFLD